MLLSLWSSLAPRPMTRVHGLKENVASLPPATGVKRISFSNKHVIEPMPGKMASVSIYSYLASKHGNLINKEAAEEGLRLYDEVVEDAKKHPGSHPNIDLLLDVLSTGQDLNITVDRE